jgi:hypothetical protein
MGPVGAGTRRMGRSIAVRPMFAPVTIAARRTIRTRMTPALVAISRWTIAAWGAFAPHAARTFVGIVAWTIVAAIVSPTATAFITIAVAVAVAIPPWRAHFIAVLVARVKIVVTRWAVETPIGQPAIERRPWRMVRPRAVEVRPLARTRKPIEAVPIVAPSFRTLRVSLPFVAPIIGRACEATMFELTPTGTSEAFPVKFAAMPVPFAFEAAALMWTGEAIESFMTASKLPAIGPAAIAAAIIHGAGWPASLKSRAGRTVQSSTFESRAACTSRIASTLHTFMDGFGQRHELVLTQLAIFVFVELLEQLGGIWRLRATTTFATALVCCALFFTALGTHFFHLFACFGALFVIKLPVFVRIVFFQHSLAHFSTAIVAFLAVLLWRLGEGRQGQRGGRNQCETRDEMSHFCSFRKQSE